MQIKLPDDILQCWPIDKFANARKELTGISTPSGTDSGGMPAAQGLLSLYRECDAVLKSYAGLIDHDSDRIKKIIQSFSRFDNQ